MGGEWGYASGLAAPGGATEGISSAGFGLFGGSNFNGLDLDPPAALDGFNYGLVSINDDPGSGNAQVTGNVPLARYAVVFTLAYVMVLHAQGIRVLRVLSLFRRQRFPVGAPVLSAQPDPGDAAEAPVL